VTGGVCASRADEGWGIFNQFATVIVRNEASVTENTAGSSGGGIRNRRGVVYLCDLAAISPNDPDDPPSVVQPCP
jgi:hypothetical protein